MLHHEELPALIGILPAVGALLALFLGRFYGAATRLWKRK